MTWLDPTWFAGEAVRGAARVAVRFGASIDDTGALGLTFDPVPLTADAFELRRSEGEGRRGEWLTLTGTGPEGEQFRSNTFQVTGWDQAGGAGPLTVAFQGTCAEAEITRRLAEPVAFHQLWWQLRRFESFGWLDATTDLGQVRIGGAKPDPDAPQRISGALIAQGKGPAPLGWFEAAEERLEHIARVMSFACGTYLRPYAERRVTGDSDVVRVMRRSDTPDTFFPPFTFLNFGPIFQHAVRMDAEGRTRFTALDPAVRWLLTPAYYDEMRLIAAMTALEHIVDQAHPGSSALFVSRKAFGRFASSIRGLIDQAGWPDGMKNKIPELNRRSFAGKLESCLAAQGVPMDDLPADRVAAMITARNLAVHRGVYFDLNAAEQADIWDHLLLAREIVTRLLLAALGFVGNYYSPHHGPDTQLRFPSCRRLADDQGFEIPEPEAAVTADDAVSQAGAE